MKREVNAEKIFEVIKFDNFPIMRFSYCLYCTFLWEYFHFPSRKNQFYSAW